MELDLHIHSKYSYDSLSTPTRILKIAEKKGLNGISITDHNSLKGSIEAKKIVSDDFAFIPGSEISTEKGHVIALFVNEEIKSRIFHEVIDEIKDQGAVSVLAHPFKTKSTIKYEDIKGIDAIEAFNARANIPVNAMCNQKALELATQHNMPVTAGSDAHFCCEIGKGRISLNIEHTTDIEVIKKSLLNDKSIVSGFDSPNYVEVSSQLIKYMKFRKVPSLNSIYSYIRK